MRAYPFNNSSQYFRQQINNAFDPPPRPRPRPAGVPVLSVRSDGPDGEREGEEEAGVESGVHGRGDAAAAALLVRPPPLRPTHTLLLLMHQQTNVSFQTSLVPPLTSHIYLPKLHADRFRGAHFYGNPSP